MAFGHGSKGRVWVNGFELTGFLSNVQRASEADVAEVSVLGNVAKQFVVGLKNTTLSLDGIFDGAAGQSDATLAPILGAAAHGGIWSFEPAGDGIGNHVDGYWADITAYNVSTSISDAQKWTGTLQSSDGAESGVVTHASGVESVTGVGASSVDNGASTANGGTGFLQVSAKTGVNPDTIKIQHSTDNITFVDLVTFTNVTTGTAPLAQRVTVPAGTTVNRYIKDAHTVGAAGTITYLSHFSRGFVI